MMLLLTVNAESPIDTTNNPGLYCTYRYDSRYLTDGAPFRVVDSIQRANLPIKLKATNNPSFSSAFAVWNSYLLEDTYYYLEFEFDASFPEGETGNTVESALQGLAISRDDFFVDATTSYFYHIEDDYYSGFYDKTAKKLYYIVYLPKDFFEQHPQLRTHNYVHVLIGHWDTNMIEINMTSWSGAKVKAPYTQILQEIKEKLSVGGGGLSTEEVQEAVEQALENHTQQEQQQAQQSTQEARQQAEQAMARYIAVMEQMKTAMSGIEEIKNIDTSTYTLTIGPFTNPMTGGVFPAVGVDFYAAYQLIPETLKTTCQIVVTFFVLMAYAREFLDVFKHVEKTMHGEDE